MGYSHVLGTQHLCWFEPHRERSMRQLGNHNGGVHPGSAGGAMCRSGSPRSDCKHDLAFTSQMSGSAV